MKHLTEERACKNCGSTFTRRVTNGHLVLCGKAECRVEWQNKLNRENQRMWRRGDKLEEKECIICAAAFQPKTRRSVCCSEECLYQNKINKNREAYHKDPAVKKERIASAREYELRHPRWKAKQLRKWRDKHKRKYQALNNEKRFGGNWLKVMDRDYWICQGCAKNAVLVHHVDKDKENNDMSNLTSLCRSCHAKLHRSHRNLNNN